MDSDNDAPVISKNRFRIFSSDSSEFAGAVSVCKTPDDAVDHWESGSASKPPSARRPGGTDLRKTAREVANSDEGVAEIQSVCEFGGCVGSRF